MKSAASTWRTTTDELRTRENRNGAAPERVHPRGNSHELGLTVSEAATVLEVRRATLSDLINNNAALSAEMALRIENPFGVKAGEIAVKPYRPPAPELR